MHAVFIHNLVDFNTAKSKQNSDSVVRDIGAFESLSSEGGGGL